MSPRSRADSSEGEAERQAEAQLKYQANKWDIWVLGLTIGLGGQYFSWNYGLYAGLYTFLIDFFVVGFAYIALCCCTSEITGALPFAGGAYGLSRCTLGYYPGYLIGCAEACEYIAYVSASVMSLAKMIVEIIPQLEGYEPIIWLLVYAHACYVHYRGDRIFWRWNTIIGCMSLLVVLTYCFGSLPHVDFKANADIDPGFRFINGVPGFIRHLPAACWFFVGVEALNLASDDVKDAKRSIPFAQVASILTLFSVGFFVFFVTVSLPPPGLNQVAKLLAPFDNGFQIMFKIGSSPATIFSIPAMYATTFGFMWGYGKLIQAMATSKLLPPALARTSERYDTPILAVVSGSVLSYFLALIVHFVPSVDDYLSNICVAAAFLGYAGQCVGYITLKRLYPSIKSSTFHSPFGIYGAVYSLCVWLLGLVSIAGFQKSNGLEFGLFILVLVILSIFYIVYAKGRQTFSSKETKVFLEAHIMRFNKTKSLRGGLNSKAVTPRPLVLSKTTALGQAMIPDPNAEDETEDKPLPLPVVAPNDSAMPFHRQFTSPCVPLGVFDFEVDKVPEFAGTRPSRTRSVPLKASTKALTLEQKKSLPRMIMSGGFLLDRKNAPRPKSSGGLPVERKTNAQEPRVNRSAQELGLSATERMKRTERITSAPEWRDSRPERKNSSTERKSSVTERKDDSTEPKNGVTERKSSTTERKNSATLRKYSVTEVAADNQGRPERRMSILSTAVFLYTRARQRSIVEASNNDAHRKSVVMTPVIPLDLDETS
ncbi:hypothetical protein Poli38472_011699 [Pythium oligandrum]|uniref:Amino acid permease/ SLC12A domain-containing protein n=1 Tax=Pythium oligandrum TaxID=41045 RepID=A0A8K1FDA7_PYTOL|nr:hypothetical protein Poli38472_011699 [Pythium oligandrum]|eukprot:TMW58111.1 hypothetical protein Poli38472_011699 [Pythium oligandrum]